MMLLQEKQMEQLRLLAHSEKLKHQPKYEKMIRPGKVAKLYDLSICSSILLLLHLSYYLSYFKFHCSTGHVLPNGLADSCKILSVRWGQLKGKPLSTSSVFYKAFEPPRFKKLQSRFFERTVKSAKTPVATRGVRSLFSSSDICAKSE